MCSPVLNSERGAGFFTGIRISTPSGAGARGATGTCFGATAFGATAALGATAAGGSLRAFAGGAFDAALLGAFGAGFAFLTLAELVDLAALAATRLASGFRPLVSFFFSGFVLRIDSVPPRGTKLAPSKIQANSRRRRSHRARKGSIGAGKR